MLRSLLISSCSLIFIQIYISAAPILAIEEDRLLSHSKVSDILNQMVKANQQKDAVGVTQFMAPFVTSYNRFITPKEILNTKVYGKSEHLLDLESEFAGTSAYKHHGYQVKINTSPDRQFAIAQENYLLEVQLPTNERVLFAIASRSKFRLINGEPKIFEVNSTVEMENPATFLTRSRSYY